MSRDMHFYCKDYSPIHSVASVLCCRLGRLSCGFSGT